MNRLALRITRTTRPLVDGLLILVIWCVILLSGCSVNRNGTWSWFESEPEGPRTVGEWMDQPRAKP